MKFHSRNAGSLHSWRAVTTLFTVFIFFSTSRADENWPQFRGPNSAGISDRTDLPVKWNKSTNVAWKAVVPGVGWSCPIVWGNRIYLTTAVVDGKQDPPKKGLYMGGERSLNDKLTIDWQVLCLDRETGKQLWMKSAKHEKPNSPIHIKNSYASETPVTDGKHVYAYFGAAGLFCYTMDGTFVWKKEMSPYRTTFNWGLASSPVTDGKNVYIQCDNQENSFLVAFDCLTGNETWRDKREEKTSWCTPLIWKTKNRTELVTGATKKIRGYDPANGKQLWELAGMSQISCPTPIGTEDFVLVSSGYVMDSQRPIYAIKPNSSGDITPTAVAGKSDDKANKSVLWHRKQSGPYIPSPVIYGNKLYVLYDLGFLACFDARTGKEIYSKQRFGKGAVNFTSSPWAYGGKIFCLSEDGDTYVVEAGDKFKVLHTNPLDELCMATPALSGNALLLRTSTSLYCFKEGATGANDEKSVQKPKAN